VKRMEKGILAFGAITLLGCTRTADNGQISRQRMADSLYAVISADREAYARAVVDRLHYQERRLKSTEHYKDEKTLPLPAQMLRLGAEMVAADKQSYSYSLLSLWPINNQNGPRTESEKAGLRAVAETRKNHYTEEELGGRRYFAAYYPDRAVVEACVSCHNEHEDSPRKDFRIGDVIGGIVIRIPMDGP